MTTQALKPFRSADAFRVWLARNHDRVSELWIRFYKKDSGRGGITYSEALDEALCFGWIDGVRKKHDDVSFIQRFTPRKEKSNWSAVNIRKVKDLIRAGRMQPPGLRAYEGRHASRMRRYSYEQRHSAHFEPATLRAFKANDAAWAFFERQPSYYRRLTTWWVTSAKRPETRAKRFAQLLADCANGQRIRGFTPVRT